MNLRNAVLGVAFSALAASSLVAPSGVLAGAGATQSSKVSYAAIPSGDFKIDPAHSIVGFAIRHLEINWVEGRFKDFSGTIHYDAADVTKSSVEFTAKIDSIDTGVGARDTHLKSADFFDATAYPDMSFKSTRVEKKGKNGYVLHGNLTLKGATKPVAIPFAITGAITDPWKNTRFGIEGTTKIDRREFGITWGKPLPNGGVDVGTDVTVTLKLEALQPAAKPA